MKNNKLLNIVIITIVLIHSCTYSKSQQQINLIDFEPTNNALGGGIYNTYEGQVIDNNFFQSRYGITFHLDSPNSSTLPIIAKMGSPAYGFISSTYGDDTLDPICANKFGSFFLTDIRRPNSSLPTQNLYIKYYIKCNEASGYFFDIDDFQNGTQWQPESWTINVYQIGGGIAQTFTVYSEHHPGFAGYTPVGDGIATPWSVSLPTGVLIDYIEFRYNDPRRGGIGFDNFSFCKVDTTTIQAPTPCCDIVDVNLSGPTNRTTVNHGDFYGHKFNVSMSTTSLITELRASIVKFDLKYSNPDCSKCIIEDKKYGTFLFNTNSSILTPISHYSTNDDLGQGYKGVREIIATGPGTQLTNFNPSIEILFPKPILQKCCNVLADVCIKFMFKDVNCRVCEKYVCLSFDKNGPIAPLTFQLKEKEEEETAADTTKSDPKPHYPRPSVASTVAFSFYAFNDERPDVNAVGAKTPEPSQLSKNDKNGGKYVTSADHFAFSQGEPVPGAELFLEQEPDEEPIMAAATGDNGLIVISGIKQGDYSLSMKFPIKKDGKKSSSSKAASGLMSSSTTDISSLKKIKSYLLSCPDGEYNLVVFGDDALSESNIEPKFDVTYNNKTNEYDIKVVSFKSVHNKGSVTSTVAFSFYAVPKNSFIPKQGTTTSPVITNPTAIKQGSAFAEPDKMGVSGAEVILTQIEARQNSGKNGGKYVATMGHFLIDKKNFDPSKINAVNKVKTNKEGDYKFEKPQTLDNGGKNSDMMNYFILNIPMQFFRDNGPSKGKDKTVSGKFNFNLETQTSKGVMNQFILLDLYNPNDPRADVWTNYFEASSGPYSESVSNLEDNICVPIPIGVDATDILSGKLYYSTVNHYGIHDEGIK